MVRGLSCGEPFEEIRAGGVAALDCMTVLGGEFVSVVTYLITI